MHIVIPIDTVAHVPPNFGRNAKPHIHKVAGQWFVTVSGNHPIPRDVYEQEFAPYLRRMNLCGKWKASSIILWMPSRVQ